MFGSPEQMAKIAADALAAGKQPESGPGEYTRFFDAPKQSEEPENPAVPAAPLPEASLVKKSKRDTVVLIVVSAVVVVALLVVAIVLARR